MVKIDSSTLVLPFWVIANLATSASASPTVTPRSAGTLKVNEDLKAGTLVNVYLDYRETQSARGILTLAFGDCDIDTVVSDANTIIIGSAAATGAKESRVVKFVWAVPLQETRPGCIVASDDAGNILARSERYTIVASDGSFDDGGILFDAVSFHNAQAAKKDDRQKIVASDKSETVGIIGAGISGLFSALLLEQAGIHNYEILEASNRLGGRLRTSYFSNDSQSLLDDTGSSTVYQEMGAMHIPTRSWYQNTTVPITDHRIVFRMADELNKLNKNYKKHQIEFIEFIDHTDNNLSYKNRVRLANGKAPTVGDVKSDPSLGPVDSSAVEARRAILGILDGDTIRMMSSDLYKAYNVALEKGYDDWSEWSWMHNKLGLDIKAANEATPWEWSVWVAMYTKWTMSAATWLTVQGGMSRLAWAYQPILGKKIVHGVKISKLAFDEERVSVQWKDAPFDKTYHSKKFDNVIVSAPFSVVRTWHLPELPHILEHAIDNLYYHQICTVSMEFKSRFWEKYDRPILGGCDRSDLHAGTYCYPSNNLKSDGPGVMMATYPKKDGGLRFVSMTDQEHVALVLEDLVKMHGDIIKEQFTGRYDRMCWVKDPFQAGGIANPKPGQHKLYMPSYFEMNNGLVFVGEHTDIKHGWISAALDSAVRGVVMILVDHGHIKEAKDLLKKWDIKWIKI